MAGRKSEFVKKANTPVEYDKERAHELVKCARDVVYFTKTYIKITHPTKGIVPFELYDFQEEVLKMYANNRYCISMQSRQTGKALDINTPILTTDGWKTMETVEVGDYVFGDDGLPTKVIFTSDIMHNRPCYKITFSNNEEIIADAEHLWVVNDGLNKHTLTTIEIYNSNVSYYIEHIKNVPTNDCVNIYDDNFFINSVVKVNTTPVKCIGVDNESKLYAAGKALIPTHNSTVACAFLLWTAAFTDNATILVAAHKNSGAMEMIKRIRFMYENLPDWLKPGIDESYWNKHELGFDNGSIIFAEATTEDTGRGKSITTLFCLGGENIVTIRNKTTGLIENITLKELHERLEYKCDR